MKITVPVTLFVDVEFDIDGEDLAEIQNDPNTNLQAETDGVVRQWLYDNINPDDLVEYITDATGWCISGLSLTQDIVENN